MSGHPIERSVAELERTRANLLQVGTIAEADYAKARVRVLVGGLTSAWLPWMASRAGGDRSWSAPEVGEQVLVACPDGDPASGVVLGAIYQQDYAAPAASADVQRTEYGDGTVVEYDRAAHRLTVALAEGGTVEIAGDVQIAGDVHVTGDVVAGTISLKTHTHGGVDPGLGNTGLPQ